MFFTMAMSAYRVKICYYPIYMLMFVEMKKAEEPLFSSLTSVCFKMIQKIALNENRKSG